MRNLFKNVFRSFSKTKTALVSLFFLMFFSLGIFAVLDSTSNNLQVSYDALVQKGNMNDFVLNEKYDYGPLEFEALTEDGNKVDQTVVANTPITIKLSDVSASASLVKLAYSLSPNQYEKYISGFQMTWEGYNSNSYPTPADWISEQIRATRTTFTNLLENDLNISVKSKLDKLPVSYRDYESVEFSDGEKLTKIVNSNYEDEINKLIIYEGHSLTQSISSRFDIYNEIYDKISQANDSTVLSDPVEKLGISQTNLLAFYNDLSKNATDHISVKTALDDAIANQGKITNTTYQENLYSIFQTSNKSEFINDTYRSVIKWTTLNSTITIQDPSMYELIVSPGNWKYLKSQKSIYTNLEELKEKQELSTKEFNDWLKNEVDPKYKIKIGATEFLIKGVGLTPDFMYPIFNVNSLIPNPQTEFLYFGNKSNYATIRSSNLTSPIEKYIVGKFDSKNHNKQVNILNEINDWCRENMSWPNSVQAAYFSDDQSNYMNLNAARTTFITTLITTISAVSSMVIGIILGLALFVSVLVIKNYISKNRFSLGVLQANGYSKKKIVYSLLPFSILPTTIGGACGYFLGLSLQELAMGIFSSYWFIPTNATPFNAVAFAITLIFPIIFFILITLFVAWYVLRKNAIESLKNDSDYKISKFSLLMKKPFGKFSVVSRFRAALAFNAFWKLIILSILSASAMVVFNFAWATTGLFEQNRVNTLNSYHYAYAVDLQTPTEQSGILKYQPLQSLGRTDEVPVEDQGKYDSFYLSNSSKNIYNWGSQNNQTQKFNWDNIHIISTSDITDQTSNITYLKDKVQSKLMLDYDIINTVNPWATSASLMPINQLSSSNDSFQKLLEAIYNDPNASSDKLQYINAQSVSNDESLDEATNYVYSINTDNALNGFWSILGSGIFKPDYLKFINNEFERIENGELLREGSKIYNYGISYNVIGLDDATIGNDPNSTEVEFTNGKSSPKYSYTRIDATDNKANQLSIQGIKNWISEDGIIPEDYLGPILSDSNNKIINWTLFDDSKWDENNPPLIVNLYTAEKYNLKVGSKLTLDVSNLYDRYTRIMNHDSLTKKVTFNVVGISNSAKDNGLYTSYEIANKILGFEEEQIRRNLPFNGYYSNNMDNYDNTMPLFSASGLYPGTNSFSTTNPIMKSVIENTIKNYDKDSTNEKYKENYEALKKALGITTDLKSDQIDVYLNKLSTTYMNLPYNSMISYITNVKSNNELFQTIASTTIIIQNIVLGIIIPIVLLVVVLISNMLIDELRKIGIKLKALGFTNWEILSSFLSIYVPVFIIGLILSIPTAIGFIAKYNSIIMTSSNIILSAFLSPGVVIGSFFMLTLFFVFSFVINWIILRKLNISQEMKSF